MVKRQSWGPYDLREVRKASNEANTEILAHAVYLGEEHPRHMDYMPAMRIIKMTNEGIFFNEEQSIPYSQTNLPKAYFMLRWDIEIYWLVALHPMPGNKAAKKVLVEKYKPSDTYNFADQFALRTVPFLQFEQLDRDAFLQVCVSYHLPSLEWLFFIPPQPAAIQPVASFVPAPIHLPGAGVKPVEFSVKFADATMVEGAIVFEKVLDGIEEKLVFTIPNPSLRAPYDTIKEYIARKLGRKTFRVTVTIKRSGRKAMVENARSEDIDRIDASFIQQVREKQIRSLLRVKPLDGRPLRKIDELLSLSDELPVDPFQVNVEQIIQGLTGDGTYRNARQLHYLAEQQEVTEVVYVTTTPYFGFVFYLQEQGRRSYIWELLDSHATYLWSFEKADRDRRQEWEMVEQNINEIREIRRMAYKQKYHSGEVIEDCRFDTIQHVVNGQSAEKSFDEWLVELTSKIKQQRMK